MDKIKSIKDWLLSRVGNPYLMGGTGQFCTVTYRQARAAQYPESAAKIKNNCPRMSGKAATCKGCRYFDDSTGNGKRAYDCAQLVKWCMDEIGIEMVSGATSQWKKTNWERMGEIDTLPENTLCIVFRQDAPGKMGHVGIALGDGSAIHAKGHDYGVVREGIKAYGKWTHWAIPAGLYSDAPRQELKLTDYEVTGTRLALRAGMSTAAKVITRMEKGTIVQAANVSSDWMLVNFDGVEGYTMAQYLRAAEDSAPADDSPDTAPDSPAAGIDDVTLTLSRETAEALRNALTAGLDGG